MEISELHNLFLLSQGVSTDSRRVRKGEIFFAVKGENFDGNQYALKALEAGAKYAVVDKGSVYDGSDPRVISFPDSLKALSDLARYHRENSFVDGKRLTVIGLTGTNGKTTSKELIREVLSKKYRVCATEGNLNNDLGVPLSLLKIDGNTQIAVIEMGASHPDDISKLVRISEPDFGLVTNVGKAHLLGFGSFEGVKKAKGQLYDYIANHGDAVFVNSDDGNLSEMISSRPNLRTIPYGVKTWNVEVFPATSENPYLSMAVPVNVEAGVNAEPKAELCIDTNLVGAYNADNVLSAIAVGLYFGVSLKEAVAAIQAYIPSNNRSQMVKTERNTLIVDAYNANPSSMNAALDNFAFAQAPNKIALLGDMRELGKDSVSEHVKILERLKSMNLSLVCLVGEEFRKAVEENGGAENIRNFPASDTLAAYLAEVRPESSLILVKGSRGIRMEKVLPVL